MSVKPHARKQKTCDDPESALPLSRHSAVDVKVVVMWIHLGGTAKKCLSFRNVTIRGRDHAGVEKKVRVFGPQGQSFLHLVRSLDKLTIAIQSPRHGIVHDNAVTALQTPSRPLQSIGRLPARSGTQASEMMITNRRA